MRRVVRLLTGCSVVAVLAPTAARAQDPCATGLAPSFSITAVDPCVIQTPSVDIFVNGQNVGSVDLRQDGKLINGTWSGQGPGGGWQATLSTTMNSDPFIIFSVGGTNQTGAPLTFGFLFSLPIAPVQYGNASSSLAGTVTRTDVGPVGGTATVNPTFANVLRGVGQAGAVNLGVDLGNLGCSATTAAGFNPRSANCGFVGAANNAFAPQAFNTLQALIDFDVSAGNNGGFFGASAASFTGSLVISAVPEPSTIVLMLGGLAGLTATIRLRRRGR